MPRQVNLLSRIGRWFRGDWNVDEEPLTTQPHIVEETPTTAVHPVWHSFLRPWARQDAAIASLQNGFTTLGELMSSVHQNMTKQAQRQDELLTYLSRLPQVLEAIPETNRVQEETLQAMEEQIKQLATQQSVLAEIRQRVSTAGAEHRKAVDAIRDHMDDLHDHNQTVAERMREVGNHIYELRSNSAATAQLLQQIRDNLETRSVRLEQAVARQSQRLTSRLTIMLGLAILVSLASVIIVCVIATHRH